jgi:hypothetical protein
MVLVSKLLFHKKSDNFNTLFDDENPYKVIIKKDDHYEEFNEKIPIKGVPGRQSFKVLPSKKKEIYTIEDH